jgi:osomolarity two-component system sensor histidine kinase SLN1
MQSSVKSAATRVLIQSSLLRYNNGNNTAENWVRAQTDLAAVFQGDQQAALLLQAQVFPINNTGLAGDGSVINCTGSSAASIDLPYNYPNGTPVTLGDPQYGFPPALYPNFTFIDIQINSTFNKTIAVFDGRTIDTNNYLLLGPWSVNETFSLISITTPIINNTSSINILGWLTVVVDGRLIKMVVDAMEGLDQSGVTMLFGPNNATNKFPNGVLYNSNRGEAPQDESVRFLLPPTERPGIPDRHSAHAY